MFIKNKPYENVAINNSESVNKISLMRFCNAI